MAKKQYGKAKGPKTPEQIRKGQKRTTVIIGAAAIVALGSLVFLPKMFAKDSSAPQVEVAEVETGDITSVLDTSGTVVSLNTKTYFSPVNAPIKTYGLKVGDLVNKGDTLVAFETENLEKDNEKAELTASVTINGNNDTIQKSTDTIAEANTAEANVQIIQGDIDNFKAYINDLNQAITSRTQELASQEASSVSAATQEQMKTQQDLSTAYTAATQKEAYETADAQLQEEINALEIQKSQADYTGDDGTTEVIQAQIDSKQKMIDANQENIKNLELQLQDYKDMSAQEIKDSMEALSASSAGSAGASESASTDSQISQWQLDLQNAQSTLSELQSNLAEEKAKVQAGDTAKISGYAKNVISDNNNMAELEASSLEELLQKGKKGISADFGGIITKAELSEGSVVTQGLELVTIASNKEVAVETTVSKYDYDKLKEGQKAEVSIAGNTYKGTVTSISRVAKQNEKGAPVINCEVTIDNPDDNIFLGVEAKVSITTASVTGVAVVPVNAVNTGKDSTFCYLIEDGKIAKREITTGVSSSDYTEITQGLKTGEEVITELPDGLTEGMEAAAMGAAETGE